MAIDRKAKIYSIKCENCFAIRKVTYAQSWNIKVGKSSGRCNSCKINLNISGLKKGRGWNRGLKGFMKGHPPYFRAFGIENPSWKGGVTSENAKIRNSVEYANWRKKVFARDNFTCQICQKVGGVIHADHIIPFSISKELRLDINNGRTLCFECHKNTDTYLSKCSSYGKKYSV